MALPFRPRAAPQCSACIRSYTYALLGDAASPTTTAFRQQIRGKKKLANTSDTVPVRLLKDVKTFGRKGAFVPISLGQMRNEWFPRRIAEYVTLSERKTLHSNNILIQRDFGFGAPLDTSTATSAPPTTSEEEEEIMTRTEVRDASMFQKPVPALEPPSPERALELLDLFVPKRLQFYRQPVIEDKKPQERIGMGAGAELLAARATKPVAIYGSVTTGDVLNAVKAAMGANEEAARVVLGEIAFVKDPSPSSRAGAMVGGEEVKSVGEFAVTIGVEGAERAKSILVQVIAQEVGA